MQIQAKRNSNSRKFEQSCRLHRNCIRVGRNQTKEHFLQICNLAWDLHKNNHDFLTEATLEGNKARADIVDLDTGEVYEVAVTEGKESLDKKELIWVANGFRMWIY